MKVKEKIKTWAEALIILLVVTSYFYFLYYTWRQSPATFLFMLLFSLFLVWFWYNLPRVQEW